jgi:predicted nucleic acid-binding protein
MRCLRLVIDANIIFAALVRNSSTRKLIIDAPVYYYSPAMIAEEIRDKIAIISRKNSLTRKQNMDAFNRLLTHITLMKQETYLQMLPKAVEIMEYIDVNDSPYLALAMSFKNDGIWTEDTDFEKQTTIKVWKTKDLLTLF